MGDEKKKNQIWILERRSSEQEVLIIGAYSSVDIALEIAKKNIDLIEREPKPNDVCDIGWLVVSNYEIDIDPFVEATKAYELISIDRLGHCSSKFQPAYFPHLLKEWEFTLENKDGQDLA